MRTAAAILGISLLTAGYAEDKAVPPITLPVITPKKESLKAEPKVTAKEIKVPAIPPRAPLSPQVQIEVRTIDGLIDLYGSKENFGIAITPDRIELMRLTRKQKHTADLKDFSEDGSVALTTEDATALRSILTSDGTFNWKEDYDCMPDYGFRVKFHQKDKTVSVDLCFVCRTLRVVREGHEIASKNFEYGYKSALKVIEGYFPGTMAKVDAKVDGL